jgi:hypothetical protein
MLQMVTLGNIRSGTNLDPIMIEMFRKGKSLSYLHSFRTCYFVIIETSMKCIAGEVYGI